MNLITKGLSSSYEVESLARMLFPDVRPEEVPSGDFILAELSPQGENFVATATVSYLGETHSEQVEVFGNEDEGIHQLCLAVYRMVKKASGKSLRWGILTGIRPIKLFHRQLALGKTDAEILDHMCARWEISREMAELSLAIAHREAAVNARLSDDGYSLYVSIPFCPARCSYCSFVSQSVAKDRSLLPQYVAQLCRELELVAKSAKRGFKKLDTIYIGGGTPTVLDESQLTTLLSCIKANFDTENLIEYTVEAGRPETITKEKLTILRTFGVDRISINPQTMQDDILRSVGRNHTAQDIVDCYEIAREMGFSCINMDLIAGLPGETQASFKNSVERLIALAPENITVHSLVLKRSSDLGQQDKSEHFLRESEVSAMVDDAREALCAAGYAPYYLYRQKGTVGNLDNTGYCKPSTEGVYNILMMDETQPVLSAGAGSVTKLHTNDGNIQRFFAHKLPYEYIRDYDRIELQQQKVVSFYETCHTLEESSH